MADQQTKANGGMKAPVKNDVASNNWSEPCDYIYKQRIKSLIETNRVVVFGRSNCVYTDKIKDMLSSVDITHHVELVDKDDEDGTCFQATLVSLTKHKTMPVVFINTEVVGGAEAIKKLVEERKLLPMVRGPDPEQEFMYDLIVIGGGSGGLAAAKEAADNGLHVACLDFVKPSPAGSTWGLGGTCVNVGCIPKKLMHNAALLGEHVHDAEAYGWNIAKPITHDWEKLKNGVQDYIGSLNWNYRTQLRSKQVKYLNAYAKFVGPHKITATNKKGKSEELTSRYFIVATGMRPRYPDIPGCPEYCISSDDIFSLPQPPGKTVVVGASYVALECAGFLAGLGYEVVVMVRSILLRGFDQQCADLLGKYMEKMPNLRFIRPCVPTKIEKIEDGKPPKLRIHGQMMDETGTLITEDCNTVLMGIGRDPCTQDIGFDVIDVRLHPKTGKVLHNPDESTSCPYVYCIGDILEDKPELTPAAIQAGRLLGRRLCGRTTRLTDYINIPTTVFTPLEYGCIGLSEEAAIEKYGERDIEVYHAFYLPLEWNLPNKTKNCCYAKLVCVKSEDELVVGFHITGPNAGEVTQGFTLGLKKGATKEDFDNAIGIHPTIAELLTTLSITKRSGISAEVEGC